MKFPLLMNADCLQAMCVIPDGLVDLILCDLPYGTTQNKWDSVIPFEPLWRDYWRVLKPDGAVVLTAQPPFDKVLGCSQLEFLKYEWIWQKTKATGHLNSKSQPLKEHENVLVFYRQQPTYSPQGLLRKSVPTVRKGRDNGGNYGKSDKDSMQEFSNFPRSILQVASEGRTVHPTQKPVALMEYLIRTYTNEGETVLDNCMDSGTTGVACKNTGRNFIGIERDPEYFKIASERIDAI
ncbi:MAG: site-specific DNA-methyltransferase [Comamonas sp.]|uniref:DNA-methyltransferase n=1 Tax=Comamonas sp. TaxID=34028 RepID=UPI002FC7F42C